MKKILIIPPQINPIPAVNGGAVESLLTNFINENEEKRLFDLYVISKADGNAEKYCFKNCKIIYIESNRQNFRFKEKISYFKYKMFCFYRKLIFNRFTLRFFGKDNDGFKCLTFFGYISYKAAKKIRPDIVLSEGNDKLYQFWQISKMVKPQNCFYHLHCCRKENINDRFLFNNSISVSNYVNNGWVVNKDVPGRNGVIYNGIDLERFSSNISPLKKESLSKSFGINPGDFVVGFAARFRPGKGVVPLLEAFEMIGNEKIKLLLIGDFVDYKEGEEEFKKRVNILINNNKNVIHVGKIPYENMQLYYSICNAQIICSTYEEASPLVAMEGMARGLPLIITKTGGLPECLNDKCCIKLDVDDNLKKNIVNSILYLYNNYNVRISMGNEGRSLSRKFTKEKYYDELSSFLLNSYEK